MSVSERKRTSFQTTEVTKKILSELKKARWDYTEVINSGIVAFSQLNDEQKKCFKEIAYNLKSEHSANARDIVREWILRIVEDAQSVDVEKKHSRKAKSSKS